MATKKKPAKKRKTPAAKKKVSVKKKKKKKKVSAKKGRSRPTRKHVEAEAFWQKVDKCDKVKLLEQQEAAKGYLRTVSQSWLAREGVTAADVGFMRNASGKYLLLNDAPVIALRAHVRRKLSFDDLKQQGRSEEFFKPEHVPKAARAEGFGLDVIEARYEIEALPERDFRRSRAEPLVGGLSVGGARASAGTLGAIVWDVSDGLPCILSNQHVLAGLERPVEGAPIVQPAPADGGNGGDEIARLKRWVLNDKADAALATLKPTPDYSTDVLGLGRISVAVETVLLGTRVSKSGRSTGITHGRVSGVEMQVPLAYGRTVVTFSNVLQIVPETTVPRDSESTAEGALAQPEFFSVENTVERILAGAGEGHEVVTDPVTSIARRVTFETSNPLELSRGGDSGSVWIDGAGRAVGLHIAGEGPAEFASEYALANPMAEVQRLLRFSFHPVFRPTRNVEATRRRWTAIRRELSATRDRRSFAERSRLASLQPLNDPRTEPLNDPRTEPLNDPRTEPLNDPRTEPLNDPRTEPLNDPRTEWL